MDDRKKCPTCNQYYGLHGYVKKQKNESEIISLFESGKSTLEISQILNKNEYSVRAYLKYRGFKLEKINHVRDSNVERDILVVDLYKKGETLKSISQKIGISGERVRQIVKRNNVNLGGLDVRSLLKSKDKQLKKEIQRSKKEMRIFSMYGIGTDLYEKIYVEMGSPSNPKSPFFKWSHHRSNSKKRGIEFKLSFAEWWNIWEQSGKWDQRGRGHGYVMARYGDIGGYELGNVYICTSVQNASDQYLSSKIRKKIDRNLDGKCKRGHVFDKVVVKENGRVLRSCTICQKMHGKKHYEKLKNKAAEIGKGM